MKGIAANISLLFRELPLLDRIAAARDAGFMAVEIQFPYGEPAERLAAAARRADIPFILINAPIEGGQGMPGIACRPELAGAFSEGLKKAAEYAAALDVRMVNVLAGAARADEREACAAQLVDNLLLAADRLDAQGAVVLLEPLNGLDHPGYLAQTPGEALDIIGRCGGTRPRLQFDVYHAAMMRLDPVAELKKSLANVAHVQVADAPGRHEPGTGRLDFSSIFKILTDGGYPGWVSAEYHPLTDTLSGLAWLESRVRRAAS